MNARLQEISNDEYEDYLNEAYGKINICGNEYHAGDILRQIDPVAFDISKQEYEDSGNIWICDNCNREYDNYGDAESCCRNLDYTTEIKKKKPKPWIVDLP